MSVLRQTQGTAPECCCTESHTLAAPRTVRGVATSAYHTQSAECSNNALARGQSCHRRCERRSVIANDARSLRRQSCCTRTTLPHLQATNAVMLPGLCFIGVRLPGSAQDSEPRRHYCPSVTLASSAQNCEGVTKFTPPTVAMSAVLTASIPDARTCAMCADSAKASNYGCDTG